MRPEELTEGDRLAHDESGRGVDGGSSSVSRGGEGGDGENGGLGEHFEKED